MNRNTDKNRIRLRVICCFCAFLFFAGTVCTPLGYCTQYQDEIDSKKGDLQDVNSQLSDAQAELKEGQRKAKELSNEIRSLENQIYTTQVDIENLKKDINETKEQLSEKLEQLEKVKKEIDDQNSALNNRLRAMYKNGDVGMLSVLFGSTTMSELLTNIEMVRRIYDADAELLESIEDRYAAVDKEKEELLALKNSLLDKQDELEQKQIDLAKKQEEVEEKKKLIDADNAVMEAEIDALNAEAEALTAKIKELQTLQAYVGGALMWPAQSSTRITSPFGYRIHPTLKVNKMHTGIDIGAALGTNILAANSGTVITAGWNNSYGYMIMIDHGGGIVTLYAHCSQLLVSKGSVVTRGQVIALVGSTGRSTGPHLHFEVREDGVYKNPLDYVTR